MDLGILNSGILIHKHSVECLHSNQTDEITDTGVDWAIRELIDEEEVAFENYYSPLTTNQVALILAIAHEQRVKSPMSQSFISKYRLPALNDWTHAIIDSRLSRKDKNDCAIL